MLMWFRDSSPHVADQGSVERSCWYLYGMRAFSLIGHLVPASKTAPGYWPGDDIEVSTLATEEYKAVSKKRMEKVHVPVCE